MIKDTLFAQYIKDRLNQEILENENGFIIYSINGAELFLAEMFVKPEARKTGSFRQLLDQLQDIAKSKLCENIVSTVHQFDKNSPQTLSSAFKYGFKIQQAHNNIITVIFKLNGGL